MDLPRRGFIGLLPALVAGTTTYFDVGASWRRHGDLWAPVQYGVDIQFSDQDLALSIDDFRDRFTATAIKTIAERINTAYRQDQFWRSRSPS